MNQFSWRLWSLLLREDSTWMFEIYAGNPEPEFSEVPTEPTAVSMAIRKQRKWAAVTIGRVEEIISDPTMSLKFTDP